MERTELGHSEIKISRIGFGGCPMGGHGWGRVEDKEVLDAVSCALDLGINLFDTADIYGLGQSEILLGKALKGRRDQAVIATKFGVRLSEGRTLVDNSPGWIRAALDQSLSRLGVDVIDIYQLHNWDSTTPFEAIVEVLEEAVRAGKIKYWGVTNTALDGILARQSNLVSFSYEYSLAKPGHERKILEMVRATGATFFSWGSLGQGILTGKYGLSHRFDDDDRRAREAYVNFTLEGRARNLRIVEAMRAVQERYRPHSLTQIALRWILDRVPGSVALVGIKRPQQIHDAASALGWSLTAEDLRYLTNSPVASEPLDYGEAR